MNRARATLPPLDYPLLVVVCGLVGLGFVMVASTSMPIGAAAPLNNPFHYIWRHLFALVLALTAGAATLALPMRLWERAGFWLCLLGIALLLLVLVPGIGVTVNGATRWLRLGGLNLQVSEAMKLFAIVYVAACLARGSTNDRWSASAWAAQPPGIATFLQPLLLTGVASALIVAQPDFGTAAVLLATVLGLLFLGGVPLPYFGLLFGLVASALVLLVWIEPYRLQRILSFMDPFADPFNTGYQLSQALIAFGRGGWFGIGLGNGIQKQYFLPEAHTDFLLATIGEELGLLGVLATIGAFVFLVWRAFAIGLLASTRAALFEAYVAHGIGLLIGLQAFVNAGVNTGLLPTKGLTLPFMSYGNNSLIMAVVAAALLLRIDLETRAVGSRERMAGAKHPASGAKAGGNSSGGGARWVRA